MAPTKRKSGDKPETASENNKPTRVTRSSTRQATTKPVAEPPAPKAKKAKHSSKQKPEPKPKTTEAPAANGGDGSKTIVIEHWYDYRCFVWFLLFRF
ncbi:hypothetical protein Hanom_Chr17g01530501 [Helianthus anomalus]